MFRVLPFCRAVFLILGGCGAVGLFWLTGDLIVFGLAAAFVIWLGLYLKGLRIYTQSGYIVKVTGNIFKRKTFFSTENISRIQIVTFHSLLPGVMKIIYPGEKVYIIGLSRGQLSVLENRITKSENS